MLIDKDTELYCSFAKKVGSTGCFFHNAGFARHNINAVYKSFSVENIEDAVKAARTLNVKGFAITMPFKKEILKYVNEIDESAKIGAANTVTNNNNLLRAYNTDIMAASDYLSSLTINYKDFYILGDGGYALAVKSAAEQLGMTYVNITRKDWNNLSTITHSLVYNCTPVDNITSVIDSTNTIIDCITSTATGKKLADMQASYQFKLYTGLNYE